MLVVQVDTDLWHKGSTSGQNLEEQVITINLFSIAIDHDWTM
jgi:phosphoribosyl-AMP cyclohydrolase